MLPSLSGVRVLPLAIIVRRLAGMVLLDESKHWYEPRSAWHLVDVSLHGSLTLLARGMRRIGVSQRTLKQVAFRENSLNMSKGAVMI